MRESLRKLPYDRRYEKSMQYSDFNPPPPHQKNTGRVIFAINTILWDCRFLTGTIWSCIEIKVKEEEKMKASSWGSTLTIPNVIMGVATDQLTVSANEIQQLKKKEERNAMKNGAGPLKNNHIMLLLF